MEISSLIQRKTEGSEIDPDFESQITPLRGNGQPLHESTRNYFESRFGYDFSGVRVHNDSHAANLATSVNAKAFTIGKDVVFGAGQYKPDSVEGKNLLAHELTHVVQQTLAKNNHSIQRKCGKRNFIPPAPYCASMLISTIPTGPRFLFIKNCDEFQSGEKRRLENFVSAIPVNAVIDILGIASSDGDADFNMSLSCERAQVAQAVIVAQGQTSRIRNVQATGGIGVANDTSNRAVAIHVSTPSSPPPTPQPPTPAPPSTTSEEACRQARQKECVMRLGGCPNTRPAGIPTPEEITRYNADCRGETGYIGTDVTPSSEECAAGAALPTVENCRLARLEETHICGPDIASPLAAVLSNVRTTFSGWNPSQRREACDAITGIPIPFVTSGFIMAWDIHELFLPETGWLCLPPYHPPCGMPPVTGCDSEDSSDCGNSVEVQNKCFLAGTVNYALLGQICRLCNDAFGVLSESTMENLIIGWKALGLLLDDPGPPIAWARTGFRGFPGNLPVYENRGQCRGRCRQPYVGPSFTWVWEPRHPR